MAKPMNMAIDAKGRLWVTTSREYPFPAPLDKPARDSIKVLELIAFLEERFGLTVVDEEMVPENLDSVARVTAFVQRKTSAAAPARVA